MEELLNELQEVLARHLNAGLSTSEVGVVLQSLVKEWDTDLAAEIDHRVDFQYHRFGYD